MLHCQFSLLYFTGFVYFRVSAFRIRLKYLFIVINVMVIIIIGMIGQLHGESCELCINSFRLN